MEAIELIQKHKGGLVFVSDKNTHILPLPIAGLMSDMEVVKTADSYETLNKYTTEYGSNMHSPFMTLAFMSLLVIPHLKLSDKGLFDVDSFSFTDLFV